MIPPKLKGFIEWTKRQSQATNCARLTVAEKKAIPRVLYICSKVVGGWGQEELGVFF
jgi:hypothetical protein